MDLQEPTRKMSTTSGTPQGTVLLLGPARGGRQEDPLGRHRLRPRGAPRGEGKEGIANLIEILAIATDRTPERSRRTYDGAGYGQFKADVAEAVEAMAAAQCASATCELRADEAELRAVLAPAPQQAQSVAAPTLAEMRHRMGFR